MQFTRSPVYDPSNHPNWTLSQTVLCHYTAALQGRFKKWCHRISTVSNLEAQGHWPCCCIWRVKGENRLIYVISFSPKMSLTLLCFFFLVMWACWHAKQRLWISKNPTFGQKYITGWPYVYIKMLHLKNSIQYFCCWWPVACWQIHVCKWEQDWRRECFRHVKTA